MYVRKAIKLLAFIFEHPSYVFRYKCDNLLLNNYIYCLAILSMSFNYMVVGILSSLIVYMSVIVVVFVCFGRCIDVCYYACQGHVV